MDKINLKKETWKGVVESLKREYGGGDQVPPGGD